MKEVSYINYNGNKVPFRVSYKALKHFDQETGEDHIKILNGEIEDYNLTELLYYYCIENGYEAINQECPFTKNDIEDIIDECFDQLVSAAKDFFSSNQSETPTKPTKNQTKN